MQKHLLLLTALTLTAACGQTKFAGKSGETNGYAGKEPTTGKSTGDANPETPVPIPSVPIPSSSVPGQPVVTSETASGEIKNDPITNTVIFGGAGVYRVGDGEASNSSCKRDVYSYKLEGSSYSFLFNVEQDDTKISFQIGRLCGIDNDRTNLFSIVEIDGDKSLGSAKLGRTVVEEGATAFTPLASELLLKKGKYAIRITSDYVLGPGSDRDDFIIGNIKVQADKPVRGTGIETK